MAPSLLLLLTAAVTAAVVGRLDRPPGPARRPVPTLATMAVLVAALAAQMRWPGLLPLLRRDAGAVAAGEWYRLFTALWFQDGGVPGGAFNIALLFYLGTAAEARWSRSAWLCLYLGTGVVTELTALWWQPIGAGNSIATRGLAGGILAGRPMACHARLGRGLRVVAVAAGVALVAGRDIHGVALLIGAGIGLLLRLRRPRWEAGPGGMDARGDLP